MSKRVWALVPVVLVVSLWAVLCRAAEEPTATTTAVLGLGDVRITQLVAVITAIGALGTAAFSLVDALKAFWGGVSNVGICGLRRVVGRYGAALEAALGNSEDGKPEWRRVVRAHWINGRPREEQKAIVKSLIRLGLSKQTAASLGAASHVSPERLADVAGKLERGDELTTTDLNVLGRLDASVEAQLDAAFDRAEQLYRNVAQACAAVVAIALAFLAAHVFDQSCWTALIVGLLAVPLAPMAKDLASSLQAAAAAMRAAK
jgi:hypothetical protein